MKRKRMLFGLAVCAAVISACSDGVAPVAAPLLQLQPCRVANVDNEVRCATFEVFENRATREGRKIALNIVVLPAIARNKEPDPVFFFAGGPGQGAAGLAREALAIVGGLNNKRDLVLIDQRGTGKSNGLNCTVPDATSPEMSDPAKRDAASRKAIQTCRDELAKKADLGLYTTTVAMADIDEVRAALGYQTINLWGGSYGTRAAMEYLRRYENRVRSVVLDGVAPPSLALPESFSRDATAILDKMIAACAKESVCAKRHADLKVTFDELLTQLEKGPRTVSVADPLTGVKRDI
ncbi:MAG: alpha/beta fold hydrolase, partial [Betaproteobacteria bacterium]